MTDLYEKIKEYNEYSEMIKEMEAVKSSISDEIKAAMEEAGQDTMFVGEYKIAYTEAKRETLDKKRLAADIGDLSEYMKITFYKRFTIA